MNDTNNAAGQEIGLKATDGSTPSAPVPGAPCTDPSCPDKRRYGSVHSAPSKLPLSAEDIRAWRETLTDALSDGQSLCDQALAAIALEQRVQELEGDIETMLGSDQHTIKQPCAGCGKQLLLTNAWMEDGCPCNTPAGVNNLNLYRWKLLHDLQQKDSRDLEAAQAALERHQSALLKIRIALGLPRDNQDDLVEVIADIRADIPQLIRKARAEARGADAKICDDRNNIYSQPITCVEIKSAIASNKGCADAIRAQKE